PRARRTVPRGQTERLARVANLRRGELRLDERMAEAVGGRGLQARTMIGEVVDVRPVEQGGEAATASLGDGDREQIVLAEEAAVTRVGGVALDRELVDVDDDVCGAERRGEPFRRLEILLRRGGRHGREGETVRPEHLVRDAKQEARVDAARIRD